MHGSGPGEYKDKDFVVITSRKSVNYGCVGTVERRPGYDTDFVHLGGVAAMVAPKHIRRVRPGDMILHP